MRIVYLSLLSSFLITIAGCGGSDSASSSSLTMTAVQTNTSHIKVFHFVDLTLGNNPSNFDDAIELRASSAAHTSEQSLFQNYVFGSASSVIYAWTAKTPVTQFSLYDDNTRQKLAETQEYLVNNQDYWLFLFGKLADNDFSVTLMPKPEFEADNANDVYFGFMNASNGQSKGVDIYVDGEKRISNTRKGHISAPVRLSKGDSSTVEFVLANAYYSQDSVIKRCVFSDNLKTRNSVVMLDTNNECRILTFK